MILALTVHEIHSSEAVECGNFDSFSNFDKCQPEVVSDAIYGMVNRLDVLVCDSFGDSRLKPSKASFSASFSNINDVRPEVYSDVIYSDTVGL